MKTRPGPNGRVNRPIYRRIARWIIEEAFGAVVLAILAAIAVDVARHPPVSHQQTEIACDQMILEPSFLRPSAGSGFKHVSFLDDAVVRCIGMSHDPRVRIMRVSTTL